jgi:hypothetical protein
MGIGYNNPSLQFTVKIKKQVKPNSRIKKVIAY